MTNTRFATAVHILTLLNYEKDAILSSDYIAGSININPAVVRKEISQLKKHGLISSKEGKGGGVFIARPAKEIRMTDVYAAIAPSPMLGKSNDPSPKCPVGKQINQHLRKLYTQAEAAMFGKLHGVTLSDFTKQFN